MQSDLSNIDAGAVSPYGVQTTGLPNPLMARFREYLGIATSGAAEVKWTYVSQTYGYVTALWYRRKLSDSESSREFQASTGRRRLRHHEFSHRDMPPTTPLTSNVQLANDVAK